MRAPASGGLLTAHRIRVHRMAAVLAGGVLWTIGCSSTDLVVSAPSAAKCQVAVDNSLAGVPSAGAAGTLTVTTTPECEWVATTATSWIAITSTPHNQGSGTLTYRASANGEPAVRTGSVAINTAQIPITQEGGVCHFEVAPLAPSAGAPGGSVDIRVETAGPCSWAAASQVSWIRVAGASQTGSGTVTLAVDANGGGARSGGVTIAGQTITLRQAAAPDVACGFQVAPATLAASATGGPATVSVTTAAACAWQATTNASWITMTSGSSGAGPGTVQLSLAANTGTTRIGTVTVAGQTVTVTQNAAVAACTYRLSPATAKVNKGGTIVTVNVMTGSGCGWTAQPNAQWLSIAGSSSGSGNGAVRVDVDKLPGGQPERVGTVTIASQTFTVTQER
jgi:hypothetical protein